MIFISVGSTRFPFARMDALVASVIRRRTRRESVFYQYGGSKPHLSGINVTAVSYLLQSDLLRLMKRARIIICHGGPGTIYQALSLGTIPWVLPREERYGEHLTDHQVAFCRFMEQQHLVRIITETTALTAILKGPAVTKPKTHRNKTLIRYLNGVCKA